MKAFQEELKSFSKEKPLKNKLLQWNNIYKNVLHKIFEMSNSNKTRLIFSHGKIFTMNYQCEMTKQLQKDVYKNRVTIF